MPQAQRVPLLERVLTVIIGNALILVGLCMYYYLVEIYESHWLHPTPTHLGAANWPTSCVYHARWAPIDSDLFQSHAWFTLPAADFQTLFLLSQDRHASGVVYFSQSADAVAVANIEVEVEVEVGVEAFYESEADDAPRPEGIGICVLRRGQGQYGIDVLAPPLASVGRRYEYGAQDTGTDDRDITLNITVWLPGPRSRSGADVAFRVTQWLQSQFQHVIGDSPPHVFGQVSFPLLNTPIELVTSITADGTQFVTPDRYVRGKFDAPELAVNRDPISAGIPDNNDFLTDTRLTGRTSSACIHDSPSGGIFHVNPHSASIPPNWNVDSASEDLYHCPAGEDSDSFELLRLSVNANPGTESPVEQSQTRCITSHVVGRGACLVRENFE